MPHYPDEIQYSPKYSDDDYEYCHVTLPEAVAREMYKISAGERLLLDHEWRGLGVTQSRGWVHYLIHPPEPHILYFRRPLGTDTITGKMAVVVEEEFTSLVAGAVAKAEMERLPTEAASQVEQDRLAPQAAAKAEAERLAAEAADKAEQERLAAIAVADLKRLAAEAADKAEEERLAAEAIAKAEAERLAAEAADTAEEPRFVALPEELRRLQASTSMRALNLREDLCRLEEYQHGWSQKDPSPYRNP